MSGDGGFAAVAVVVQQLLAFLDVSGSDEDEVRDAADVVQFGLAVAVFTVIYQPTHTTRLFSGVHAVETETAGVSVPRSNVVNIRGRGRRMRIRRRRMIRGRRKRKRRSAGFSYQYVLQRYWK